jgi:hypothetical protein
MIVNARAKLKSWAGLVFLFSKCGDETSVQEIEITGILATPTK